MIFSFRICCEPTSSSAYSTCNKLAITALGAGFAAAMFTCFLAATSAIPMTALYIAVPAATVTFVAGAICSYAAYKAAEASDTLAKAQKDRLRIENIEAQSKLERDYPNTQLVKDFFVQFQTWQRHREKRVDGAIVREDANKLNGFANQLYKVFYAFKIKKMEESSPDSVIPLIPLQETAEALKIDSSALTSLLFNTIGLPEASWKDLGCLNAFFVMLPSIWGAGGFGRTTFFLSLQTYYDSGHPLWPESKAPSQNTLTKLEFAKLAHLSPKNLEELMRGAGLEVKHELSSSDMGRFCDYYVRGRNVENLTNSQTFPTIWGTAGDFSEYWTQEKQLSLKFE